MARRGYHIFREYSVDPLERVFVEDVMTPSVQTVPANMTVAAFMDDYLRRKQKYRGYPVVDDDGGYAGMLTVAELLENAELMEDGQRKLGELVARDAEPVGYANELCRAVAARMVHENMERLAVLDPESGALAGIVTRSDLLKPAAQYYEQEELRERVSWWKRRRASGA